MLEIPPTRLPNRRRVPFGRQLIALLLAYAILLQLIPQGSRVTQARTDELLRALKIEPPSPGSAINNQPTSMVSPPAPAAETIIDAVISVTGRH